MVINKDEGMVLCEWTAATDLVEVVRCKNCKYYENGLCANINFLSVRPDDFCSYAERIHEVSE